MSQSQRMPKEPMIAVILSLIVPGAGQAYSGKFKRGVSLGLKWLLITGIVAGYILSPRVDINKFIYFLSGVSVDFNKYVYFLFGAPILFLLYICFDAIRSVKEYNAAYSLKRKVGFMKSLVLSLIFVIFVLILNPSLWAGFFISNIVGRSIMCSYRINGDSMYPALIAGDHVLVNKLAYKAALPKRGDVVLIKSPMNASRVLVSRIIGLPGETIEINNGNILINGKYIPRPLRMKEVYYYNAGVFGNLGQKFKIPVESYYVIVDNNRKAEDSRIWGAVNKGDMIGEAFKIYFPLPRFGPVD